MAFVASYVFDWATPTNKTSGMEGEIPTSLNPTGPVVYNSSPLFVRTPAPDTVAASGGGTVGYPIV